MHHVTTLVRTLKLAVIQTHCDQTSPVIFTGASFLFLLASSLFVHRESSQLNMVRVSMPVQASWLLLCYTKLHLNRPMYFLELRTASRLEVMSLGEN